MLEGWKHSRLSQKSRQQGTVFLLLAICLFSMVLLSVSSSSNQPSDGVQDIFIFSAYFYNESRSLGRNAVAVVIAGDQSILEGDKILRFKGISQEQYSIQKTQIQRVTIPTNCPWITMASFANFDHPVEDLEIDMGGNLEFAKLQLRYPQTQKTDVVACISPLFANDQWQLTLIAMHIYKEYGAHVHLYIRSMVDPLFRLIKQYEEEGFITIQPYPRMQIMASGDPNRMVEFRNQAAEQTDCLLQYKESAEFITFLDLDDVLIPRLGNTYMEEFNLWFAKYPNAAYVKYKKEDAHLETINSAVNFRIDEAMNTIKFTHSDAIGKFVVRPSSINHTWIHWPAILPIGKNGEDLPPEGNSITHLNWIDATETVPPINRFAVYDPTNTSNGKRLFSEQAIQNIKNSFEKMKAKPAVAALLPLQPQNFTYHNAIKKCFRTLIEQLVGKQLNCPHLDFCNEFLPPLNETIPCYNALTSFSSVSGSRFRIHTHNDDNFQLNDACRL